MVREGRENVSAGSAVSLFRQRDPGGELSLSLEKERERDTHTEAGWCRRKEAQVEEVVGRRKDLGRPRE